MSGYRPRPYLTADVGPMACLVLRRQFGAAIEQHAQGLASSSDERNREAAAELRDALDRMREAELAWRSRQSEDGASGSVVGTSELAAVPLGAECGSPLPMEDSSERTARQVASECRVSASYVRRLCRKGTTLRGRLVGGVWFIEAASVAQFKAKRRPVA